jgi:hypothetical protein
MGYQIPDLPVSQHPVSDEPTTAESPVHQDFLLPVRIYPEHERLVHHFPWFKTYFLLISIGAPTS